MLVNASGGKDTVMIHSNVDWTVTGIPNWIQMNATSGSGDYMLILTTASNQGLQSLTTDIIINGTDVPSVAIKVTQNGTQPLLSIDKSSFTVDPVGGKDSIIITSNVDWTITIPVTSPWIIADKITGTAGVAKVYFTSKKNLLNQSRNAVISIGSLTPGIQSTSILFSQENLGVTSFSPVKGPANTTVTIAGNFGPNPMVTLNNIACTVTSSSSNQIVFTTPFAGSTGKIAVSFSGVTVTSANDFMVTNTWIKVANSGFDGSINDIQNGVSFVWNNKIYFGLGINPSGAVRLFKIFDPVTNVWSQGPTIPAAMYSRTDAGCTFSNGVAYFALGHYGSLINDTWSLDLATTTWKQLPSFTSGSISPICFEVNNTVYVGQPRYEPGVLKKYLPSSNTWQNVTNNFPQIQSALCFTIGSFTYVAGGFSQTSGFGFLKTNYKFDPNTNSITQLSDIPSFLGFSQAGGSCGVLNGKGYVICLQQFYQYDPVTDTWLDLNSTGTPDTNTMSNHELAVVNNTIYAWQRDGTVFKYVPL